jgi:glycosyltransferase involved in cell wall biosynthesis
MKILLTNSSEVYGGGEFFVLELAAALKSRGHGVIVACKPAGLLPAKCREHGVDVVSMDFPPKERLMFFIRAIRDLVRDRNIDIVHTNSNYDRTAGAFAARLSGRPHITNVHSFHSLQHNLTHWIRNRFATDHFLVDGVCVRDLLVRKDGIDTGKISVVYLGVDPEAMKRDEVLRTRVREELGVADGTVLIGNVGRLVPMKGQEHLVRAFAMIAAGFPAARLAIIGDGELHDHLIRLSAQLGVAGSVLFPGFRDDLAAVYSAFDVYVHPSIEGGGETFPFAVLQALSQELPVVVTRVGDVPAMVEEGVNGFVVPDARPDELAARMKLLLDQDSLRFSMAAASRSRLLAQFTTGRMVDEIVGIYDAVLRNSRA